MAETEQTRDFDGLEGDASASISTGVGPGTLIGRYKLLEEIGEGGFGTVYLAQQLEPVKRRVALKVIKLGMDTRQVIARFEAERQALALMDHPHIARVLDAGATDSGRPYFVMELVRGEPVTEYADRKRLSPLKRLELFLQICHAVQHAHQKGIIHRDIKPSNVLVTSADNHPHVKVIDFGIAKATNSELTEKTLHTEFHQLVGTPVYMSPEQAERAGVDVDTRTDIYSLGVMLYEMLTGTTPFDLQRMRTASWNELQRIICDEDPPTMSARISGMGNQSTVVARNRDCEPKRLKSMLRGDLDWIVMKGMEKDRSRRYGTAAEFAEDIARYIRDDPVGATPPTSSYRFRKFARRNRIPLTIAGVLVSSLLVGLMLTTYFMFWALSERDKAQEANQRAALFSSLAGTTFLNPNDVVASSKQWGDQILALQKQRPLEDAERIRQECQYATWLLTQATNYKRPDLLASCVVDLEELQKRAKRALGPRDPHFLSLINGRVQAAILLEQRTPKELASLFQDVVASVRDSSGEQDSAYTNMVVERAIAAMLANAGTRLPPAEALAVVAEAIGKMGLSLDPKSLSKDPQVRAVVDRVNNWTSNPGEVARQIQQIKEWFQNTNAKPDAKKARPSPGKD